VSVLSSPVRQGINERVYSFKELAGLRVTAYRGNPAQTTVISEESIKARYTFQLYKKSISTRSNYCPFELFSGVEARMTTAIRELLRSPQNNLKIFKDGLVVYDQESSASDLESILDEWFRNAACSGQIGRIDRIDEFCDLMLAALTRPFAQDQLEVLAAPRPRDPPAANQAPIFCAEPSAVARAEWCLRFTGKVGSFS